MEQGKEVLASLRGVYKRYGALAALDGVDLDLHAGQVLALLGPNGAGKTTTIGLLLGLLRADAGQVRLFGDDPQQLSARRNIGVMLQEAQLPETLSVAELLRLSASYYPVPRAVDECAALAGIEDLLQRRYGRLSGGQQRRVQFAVAICGLPRLLFLDEPTVGLDLPDRICVMRRGQVVSDGSVAALRARVLVRTVRCQSQLDAAQVARWPGVRQAQREGDRLHLACDQVEAVVRRLLAADPDLSALEVKPAGLEEAFYDLTHPHAQAA